MTQPLLNTDHRRAAVLGSPIAHSLSPVLHTAAYAALRLPWTYTACDVDEQNLAGFLAGLDADWAGLSLTMPLKRAVLPLLDEVTPLAAAVGAANTVVLREGDGSSARLCGDNTDVPGMAAALAAAGVARVERPVLLGAGATAGSALAALQLCGAVHARVIARDAARTAEVHEVAQRLGVTLEVLAWPVGDGRAEAMGWVDADVVVSTTPAGATDAIATVLSGSSAVPAQLGVLFDVVYAPWPTSLATAWSGCGGRVISGFELLLEQAALQVELMTGRPCRSLVLPAMRSALVNSHETYSRAPDRPMGET